MTIINIEHIHKVFGEKVIFEDASFGIHEGNKIGIVGINGTGKTSLLRMIAGIEEPDQGQIIRQNGLRIAYLPQNPEFPSQATILSYALDGNNDTDWLVQSNLNRLGITGYDMPIEQLSGGQKRRVALAKVLASEFDVLLLDEPTNHLDMESITALNNGLIKFPGVILFTSHDHQFVQTTANRIMEILPNGTLIDKITTYDEYLASDEMAKKRHVYEVNEEDAADN